jgi:hypothetical protein
MLDNMRTLHPRGAANRGICVDAEGAMLGPDCVLVRHTPGGFRGIGRDDASTVQKCLLDGDRDDDWLFQQCRRIAEALDNGEIALAQIYGLRIPIDDLDDRQLRRIASAGLAKASFNPDEPRVPKGDPHGGEWTTGGGDAGEQPGSLLDAAYPGIYHNWVVAQIAERWRARGAKVLTSVDLIARNGATARADIIAVPPLGTPPVLIEVKNGKRPAIHARTTGCVSNGANWRSRPLTKPENRGTRLLAGPMVATNGFGYNL